MLLMTKQWVYLIFLAGSLLLLVSLIRSNAIVYNKYYNTGFDAFANNLIPSLTSTSTSSFSSTQTNKLKNIGRQIVDDAFRESWADFVMLCNADKIRELSNATTAGRSWPLSKDGTSLQPKQPSTQQVSPKMKGLRICLELASELAVDKDSVYHTKFPWWFRTLLRDMQIPRNGMFGIWHQLQFDHPRTLELCVYEKGGTKKFRNAHCRNLNDGVLPKDARRMSACYMKQRRFDMYAVTDRVVFLRDPLDRFLSGFLDKCIRRPDVVDHCEPTTVFYNKSTSPVHNLLWDKRFFFDMYVDTLGLQFNMHFFPQAMQCGGLYHSLDSYKFVGSLGTDFYRDLRTFSERYPELQDDLEAVFKLSQRGEQDNEGGVETGAANQVLEYYTPRTVRRVLEYFAIDYVMLNLSIPQWAENMLLEDS